MTEKDMIRAKEYIQKRPEVQDVLITGGDPLGDEEKFFKLLDILDTIKPKNAFHASHFRIVSRIPSVYPSLMTTKLIKRMKKSEIITPKYKRFVEVGMSFHHPDEFTPEAEAALTKIKQHGLDLYIMTLLMKGINDDPKTLRKLGDKIRQNGARWYYIYHMLATRGCANYLQTSVQRGLDLLDDLGSSGFVAPDFVLLTSVGKVRLKGNQKIVGRLEKNGKLLLKVQTKYKYENLLKLNPHYALPEGAELNDEGRIIVQYEDIKD